MKTGHDRKLLAHIDWQLAGVILAIITLGLLNLYSSTYNLVIAKYFGVQMVWLVVGVLIAFILSLIDYRIYERFSDIFFWSLVVCLILVLAIGRVSQGAQRWIQLGPIAFQPSEIMKIGVILVLGRHFQKHHDGRRLGVLDLFIPLLYCVVPFILILKQPDLGTGLVVLGTGLSILLFVGVKKRIIIVAAFLVASFIPVAWQFLLHDYQKDRVITFLNPEKFPLGKGYQVIQSRIAIGSGELAGKGYLKGTQSKLQFLPKQHTDFAFSNFAEEFGFIGSTILLALYASVGVLGFNIALTARDSFGMYLAFGLTAKLISQAVINLGMEIGLLPVVGITLPLFSYGGSSFLTTLMGVGILLNISSKRFIFKSD
ncbi:MAG: rod shape-determining protein RodA [Bdellovibrionales bacterium]|nr:rod shape-determining protein RodA [Bdellovibrionales bacterium]